MVKKQLWGSYRVFSVSLISLALVTYMFLYVLLPSRFLRTVAMIDAKELTRKWMLINAPANNAKDADTNNHNVTCISPDASTCACANATKDYDDESNDHDEQISDGFYNKNVQCSNIKYRNVAYEHRGRKRIQLYSNESMALPEDEFAVPNIVHYVWFANEKKEFQFYHMLSVLSVHKYIKPDFILFHTNNPPFGPYWERVRNLPELRIIQTKPTICLFGEQVKSTESHVRASDVTRMVLMIHYGGIYLDLDVLVVKPFDDLRKYQCTLGLQGKSVCGGIIICSPDSPFLLIWSNYYLDDYRVNDWGYNSGHVPTRLITRYPDLVHVEKSSLNYPGWKDVHLKILAPTPYDYSYNYAIHLFNRKWPPKLLRKYSTKVNESEIPYWDNTYGEIVRNILQN